MTIDGRTLKGRLSAAGDDGFEQAALPWNRAVRQPIAAVVEAEDAADVAAVVRQAAAAGLRVATQPNGHGATTGLDGEVLLRTSRLRAVEVRPAEWVARVEAGASWGELLAAAAKHDLTGLAGSSPIVSVAGYSLGGGLSWYGRAHGLAGNAIRALEVVDAEGGTSRVTADSDPELFWALRGGGGDFGVVTALELALFPASRLYGGRMMWPAARAAEVMAAFREITATAPEELTLWFTLAQFPPFPEVPEPLRGLAAVMVDLTFLGAAEAGRALVRPLESVPGVLLDTRGDLPVAEVGGICAEPVEPMPALLRAELLTGLGDDAVAALLEAAAAGIAPLATVQVRHLGGALARAGEDAGACGHVAEPYLLSMIGPAPVPEVAAAATARQEAIVAALSAHTSGLKPFTFLGDGETAAAAFPPATLERLRAVKRARDPRGVFRSNYPVLG
ncbi:FAD-binding protein [Actinomadura sp. ATCC 31491]|uniref:FAD-binding protein n=1 Tax=Actinomadura luzonensis TaxID=2805427 RepID=A0ABT0FP23_9ACTN|nr:FAD-binding protein [Actinomadura luzonensis]MCK2214084.1 FAD-binding protein [Actinomadura luzonensis]